ARLALPSRPARYSLRQPNTWLELTPCDSATRATDAPSTKVSSTIRRFSSIGRYCRLGLVPLWPLTVISSVACVEVSISAPSGHDPYVCPQRTRMSCSHTSVQTVTSVRLPHTSVQTVTSVRLRCSRNVTFIYSGDDRSLPSAKSKGSQTRAARAPSPAKWLCT